MENLSSGLKRFGAGVTTLFRGAPGLTDKQERLLEQMEADYKRVFGESGSLKTDLKNSETELRSGGHQ